MFPVRTASPVLVYDNLNTVDYGANFSTGSTEVGDEIGLAYKHTRD